MVICLERGADWHMSLFLLMPLPLSCSSKIRIGFTVLVPAHPGSAGQRAAKRVCVCTGEVGVMQCVSMWTVDAGVVGRSASPSLSVYATATLRTTPRRSTAAVSPRTASLTSPASSANSTPGSSTAPASTSSSRRYSPAFRRLPAATTSSPRPGTTTPAGRLHQQQDEAARRTSTSSVLRAVTSKHGGGGGGGGGGSLHSTIFHSPAAHDVDF